MTYDERRAMQARTLELGCPCMRFEAALRKAGEPDKFISSSPTCIDGFPGGCLRFLFFHAGDRRVRGHS
jgi:hypothetical protein